MERALFLLPERFTTEFCKYGKIPRLPHGCPRSQFIKIVSSENARLSRDGEEQGPFT
jgi:hypothetical protein